MVDIDEILATAIRNALLQVNSLAPRPLYRIEVATAQRIRAALEREGVIITEARPLPEAGWMSARPSGFAKRQQPGRTANR
jgi:hypothetical protein